MTGAALETMTFRRNLGARIAYCAEIIGTKSESAARAGVTAEQLNKWISGAVKVPIEAMLPLSKAANVDFSWLTTGEGRRPSGSPVQARLGAGDQPREGEPGDERRTGLIRLPVYGGVLAAAGISSIPADELSEGVMSFDPRFLRDQGAKPEKCTVIWAHGDSMMPTIPDGSALIVDHSQTEVKNGSIMVINVGEDLLVKRVRRRMDGLIDLISDNTAYQPETLGPDALQQLRVIGRVVYFCRTP